MTEKKTTPSFFKKRKKKYIYITDKVNGELPSEARNNTEMRNFGGPYIRVRWQGTYVECQICCQFPCTNSISIIFLQILSGRHCYQPVIVCCVKFAIKLS